MNVYMLQDIETGLFYKRRGGWVSQEQGAIWTNKSGVNAGKGSQYIRGHDVVVRTFKLEEV